MRILVIGRDPKLLDRNSEVFQRVREYASLFDTYYILNIGIRESKIQDGNLTILSVSSRLVGAIKLAKKIVREKNIDMIDAQDAGEAGLVAWRVGRATGLPFRLQIHTDIFSPWYRRASWKEHMRYVLARFLIPRADCIRVVSERIKRSIESRIHVPEQARYGAGKNQELRITVLPIFTDVSKFLTAQQDVMQQKRFRDYDFRMVAVGRFVDKEKNFSMLIETMRDFVKVCPKALLVLVGDGPDRNKYELRIKNYGLEKCVTMEKVPYALLPSYLKSFDLFLLSSNYEGWGRVVIEAMAAGLPVVMTDVGLAGEVVRSGENGVVVPVGDKQAFFEAFVRLYKDSSLRQKFGRAGRDAVENLGPKTKEQYLKAYEASYCNSKA